MSTATGGPSALAVVVPAHDEAGHLPATLRSVRTAALHPGVAGVTVLTVVAADACTDGTAAAARRAGALVVELARRNVGAARAAGVSAALDRLRAHGDGVWIVTTDADTLVPPHWLAHHMRHARDGWDCLAGTVRLAPHAALSPATAARHDARYFDGRPAVPALWSHPHVHGANLGIAAAAYRRAGGFPPLAYSEDRALVAALERDGRRILRTDLCPVLTSPRSDARAPHGFGAHLRALARSED
ncbi:glycosyltransferase [Streptomyces liangshanensis]|uniref:4,4'-diaponeurosporenoate glycosyltransferase n=1 Tax=Streptomyces liangshanensis TaxID=2717324 RepID=A0A6G9H727_9ACTN|nr:glycosyltransferase [Streptomyces liangshanensis]QIQ06254.1 glycosyltransferase [Streptomyces liangshanensis]